MMPDQRKPRIHRPWYMRGRWVLDWPKEDGTTMRRAHYRTWQDAMDDCAYLYKRRADPLRII